MTEIKLMNYGRGAGKTHTLKSWQQENPKHRFIVCLSNLQKEYPEVAENRLVTQIQLAQDKSFFVGFQNWEVAFDGFDLSSYTARDALAHALRYHPKTVILATSYDTVETEAAKSFTADSWRRFQGFKTDGKGGILIDGGTIKVDGSISAIPKEIKAENIKAGSVPVQKAYMNPSTHTLGLEPVQSVKAKDLRIGDYVVGKGHVTNISSSGQPGYVVIDVVEMKDSSFLEKFRGTFPHINGDTLLDVDLTKRK
jgi:hypothetical protein